MSDQRSNNPDSSRLPLGSLLRAGADGDLTPEEQARLDSLRSDDPEVDARLGFERELRASVGRTMANPAKAPKGLRDEILAAWTREDESHGVLSTPLGDTRKRDFWSGFGRFAAVAAVLALCAVVVIVAANQYQSGVYQGPEAVQVASFVSREHDRCEEFAPSVQPKFRYRTPEEARANATQILNAKPAVLEMPLTSLREAGYEFAGFGPCGVPGPGRSAHLLFHSKSDADEAVSLFIQEDADSRESMKKTCCYLAKLSEDDPALVVWRDDAFIYYLYASNERALEAAREDFNVPAERKKYL